MSDSSETFVISEQARVQQRRIFMALIPTILICICFITLVVAEFDVKTVAGVLPYLLGSLALMAIFAVFVGRADMAAWSRMRLDITAAGLRLADKNANRDVAWDTITKVRTRHNPRGEARLIDVFPAEGRSLRLYGFGAMPDILALIQSRVPPTAQVLSIRQRVDRENPLLISAIVFVITMIVTAVLQVSGDKIFLVLYNILMAVWGVWFAWYGPVSRMSPRYRRWEIAGGIFFVLCSLVSLAFKAW